MPPPPKTATSAKSNPIISQISTNLSNTLSTFGPKSAQYVAVLDMLRESIRELELEMQGITATTRGGGGGGGGGGGEETTTADAIEELRMLLEKGLSV
ncbi:hypothetical protein EMPG_15521 [Blastomyces silverae]|uniref:Uncharacterized protein n=1 Tax=Blastomyces silverae TaxID=2060906 RepID=A0A0H1BCH8_9EURO|nr:hypothetical protein EMPG_15521 [Blastomyces silverae]